jgi:hypothetical protein
MSGSVTVLCKQQQTKYSIFLPYIRRKAKSRTVIRARIGEARKPYIQWAALV